MDVVNAEKIPKMTLKDALYGDQKDILIKLANETDSKSKECYQYAYKLISKYINICKNRNRF